MGCKSDLRNNIEEDCVEFIDREVIRKFCTALRIEDKFIVSGYYECSAVSGSNITNVFNQMIRVSIDGQANCEVTVSNSSSVPIQPLESSEEEEENDEISEEEEEEHRIILSPQIQLENAQKKVKVAENELNELLLQVAGKEKLLEFCLLCLKQYIKKREREHTLFVDERQILPEIEEGIQEVTQAREIDNLIKELDCFCMDCKNPIHFGDIRYHCFLNECSSKFTENDVCEACFLKHGHKHRCFKEQLYLPNDMSWRIESNTICEILDNIFHYFATRPLFGYRKYNMDNFTWLTFSDVKFRVRNFGNGLRLLIPPRSMVGICSSNRVEHYVADMACMYHNMVTVPIHADATLKEYLAIIQNADIKVIICDKEHTEVFKQCKPCATLLLIIQMDELSPQQILDLQVNREEKLSTINSTRCLPDWLDSVDVKFRNFKENIPVCCFGDVEKRGIAMNFRNENLAYKKDPNCLFTIKYTSGSSGVPKGVSYSHKSFINGLKHDLTACNWNLSTFSYEPISHSTRNNDFRTIKQGGCISFYNPHFLLDPNDPDKSKAKGMSLLFEEIRKARPSSIAGVPRIWEILYNQFRHTVKEYCQTNHVTNPAEILIVEQKALDSIYQLLGGRLFAITTGGAPTSPAVMQFLERLIKLNPSGYLFDSYGITEFGSIASNGHLVAGVEIRLIAVPEMGYYPTDPEHPSGQIVVRNKQSHLDTSERAIGYYKNEALTANTWVDGWYWTGDIGLVKDRKLYVIDRIGNHCKLQQGEFIVPAVIEGHFQSCEYVSQCYLYVDSLYAFPLLVVVPSENIISEIRADPASMNLWKHKITDKLIEIAISNHLKSYEIPRDILIETELLWLPQNGFFTATNKVLPNIFIINTSNDLLVSHSPTGMS